ncbi:MAG TPA: PAS domain-containing protein [Bryobacteraceae bacterium]|nr:PAS domain-containing protein [Bryobacteraceae bacterium]
MIVKPSPRILDPTGLSGDLLLAAVAVATGTGLRLLLAPLLYDRAAFVLFALAVMIVSWVRGRRAGLITTALATTVGMLLFVLPFPEAINHSLQNETLIVLFVVEGCGISFLAGQLHSQRARAKQEALMAKRARDEMSDLIESIPDGFQAYDSDFRLAFMNRSAESMLERKVDELIGTTIWDQFPALDTDVEQLLRRVMLTRLRGFSEAYYAPLGRWFSFHVNPFREGISVLYRDVSMRRNAEAERERLIRELQSALAQVRTLRGLIPICAWCKKIRNDHGYWEQLELFIKNHSEADFTHGMCPDCAKKHTRALAG